MDTPTEHPAEAGPQPAPMPLEPRQRWRLTFARAVGPDTDTPVGREYIALWETALADSRLPVASTDAGRFRFALAAPLPARTAGRAELADLWLTERVAAWQVREALDRVLPPGHELRSLENVWLGAPALAGRVAAAEYAVTLRAPTDATAIAMAADRLLAAAQLVRERSKGGGVKTYDLRPLILSIETATIATPAEHSVVVRVRTRIHPELGSGRPEEVIAALAEEVGSALEPVETIRERLVLIDDLDA